MTVKACRLFLLGTSLISLLLVVCSADAHESHDTVIQRLENQLDQLPESGSRDSVVLMLRRADLHRRQRNWRAALHDYQHVADQEPDNIAMMLGRTQLHLDQHQYSLAEFWSTRVRRLQPEHAKAALLYARALKGSGDTNAAAKVYGRGFNRLDKPLPENFIEYAQMLLATKDDPDHKHNAIATLDKGAEALGHPVSLHRFAYELERASGQLDEALTRIDNVLERNSSLLTWRLQRAELLLELARPADAFDEIRCVIDKISKLPAQRLRSSAFQELLQRSEQLQTRLETMGATSVNPSEVQKAPNKQCQDYS